MTMLDDYSGFAKVYLLRDKSEATKKLKEYITEMKVQFYQEPEVIRSDRAERVSQILARRDIDFGIQRSNS